MSYAFRHKSSSTSSSMSRTSSRSTSTGTPPQTPTIRVTSPVPDAIGVIDMWDPEILSDEEPQAPSSPVKTYSFRYSEEKKRTKTSARTKKQREAREAACQKHHQKTRTPSAVQSESPSAPLLPEDEGLKTGAGSDESSDAEETSQISAVTQLPLDCLKSTEDDDVDVDGGAEESQALLAGESVALSGDRPVKKVQFNRSLSLVPTSDPLLPGVKGTDRIGAGRRYSSLDGAAAPSVPIDLFPVTDEQPQPVTSGCQVLSPTPESALEADQSPIQDPAPNEPDTALPPPLPVELTQLSVTIEEAPDEEQEHEPTCDLFDRLREHKNDDELMDVATDFVMQLLRTAQEEALRRGHQAQSKIDQKGKLSLELQHVAGPKSRTSRKWYRRLRALLLRTLTCTCVPTHPNIQSPLSN